MRKSIRLSLLWGHGGLLAVAIVAFGVLVFTRVQESTFSAVDAELSTQAAAITRAIEPVSGERFELKLSEAQSRYFRQTGHYVIRRNREVADYSDPEYLKPATGPMREVVMDGPIGTQIVVGRSTAAEQDRLDHLVKLLVSIGAMVFVAGLAGGWLLVGQLLNPIRRMTQTAGSISDMNLSSRIDLGATENELAELARTLNATFDRLEASVNQLRRFTADASHELRTPISVLMTQMELALKKPRSPEEYREVLETCLKATRRLASMAEDLLFLSRADAKAVDLRREPLDLKEVVDEAVGLVRPLAEGRGIRLSVESQSQPLVGDRVRLEEAVTNLVTNAIQYNRPDGQVDVTLRDGVLAVSDTGAGIPEEDRSRVFERFYRADKARSRNAGGAGLGLAITKWIVESHGGSISFDSRTGEGTTFRVSFLAKPA